MKEQKEEQDLGSVKMDASSVTKKRDTSFVDARKEQIRLYGNYYPSNSSAIEIIHWIESEQAKLTVFLSNLGDIRNEIYAEIESEKQAKLASLAASLSESEKEQLKSMLG